MVHGALTALPVGVPVDPDRETAHRWLLEELSQPEYSTAPSLLERLLQWIGDLFDGLSLGEGRFPLAFVLVVVAVVVAAVAWWVAGPVRLTRRRRASVVVLGDDERSADELRAAADAAAARGDWSAAVLDRFRALVRSLEERVVLDERPGRTAQEAAHDAAARLPAVADELHRAAGLFDDVCYGTLPARPEDDGFLRDLDARVRDLRPAPGVSPPAASEVSA
jgi:type IV secretory pathway VirB2 component (pilin)